MTDRTHRDPQGATRRRPLWRRLLLRFAAVSGAGLLAVLLCEFALRLVAPVPFHEWAIWESEGHIRGRFMPNQMVATATGHEIRINRHGFRGPDYSFEKPAGTLRIEVFGGSAAFCYKAAGRDRTWPGALEIKLAERLEMPVEVINLALPGFASFNSKINYLCYGRAFEPDAIIVYHTWNDLGRMRDLENAPYDRATSPPNRPLWMRVARATQIGRRLRSAEFVLRGRRMDFVATKQEGTGRDLDRPLRPRALPWERQNFVDFATWAGSDGVLPILVSQAGLLSPDNIGDPDIRMHMAGGAVARGYTLAQALDTWMRISVIIEEVAQAHDAVFVDGYNAVPHDLRHVRDNVHLFDRGSERLADAIAKTLLANPSFLRIVERVRSEARRSAAGAGAGTLDRLDRPGDDSNRTSGATGSNEDS